MGAALTITRTDRTAAELRTLAANWCDGAQVRRWLALASVLEGTLRTGAAQQSGLDRQTLRGRVQRDSAAGMEGLKSRRGPGRSPTRSDAPVAGLKALVIAGPDPVKDWVVRWRCLDLRAAVARCFSVEVHESTIAKWLHQSGLTRPQPRPLHPKQDIPAQEDFGKSAFLSS